MESTSESIVNNPAPGCFASPSVFSQDSEICQGCPGFDACSVACIETLQALREKINIEDILARHRRAKSSKIESAAPVEAKPDYSKFMPSVRKPPAKVERKAPVEPTTHEVSAEYQAIIDPLPKKARALAIGWVKRGIVDHVRTELAQGRNPFASQARQNHESVLCDELLKGTVTKTSLKKAFMANLGKKEPWDETTASSHVNIGMPALIAFGIAIETSEGYALVPRSVGDNVV
jgi:hypothetical protein